MNLLKLSRVELKLSQLELATASGVPRYVIQLAEQAIRLPTPDQQDRLSEALGCNSKELFKFKEVTKVTEVTNHD